MNVFIMVMRKKTTLFLDANELTTVAEIKTAIHGILKVDPGEQRLYYDDVELEDNQTLEQCGIGKRNARIHRPAEFGLAIGSEDLEIAPLSSPPGYQDEEEPQETTMDTD